MGTPTHVGGDGRTNVQDLFNDVAIYLIQVPACAHEKDWYKRWLFLGPPLRVLLLWLESAPMDLRRTSRCGGKETEMEHSYPDKQLNFQSLWPRRTCQPQLPCFKVALLTLHLSHWSSS